jgi:hypothetical protein
LPIVRTLDQVTPQWSKTPLWRECKERDIATFQTIVALISAE